MVKERRDADVNERDAEFAVFFFVYFGEGVEVTLQINNYLRIFFFLHSFLYELFVIAV